MTGYCQLQLGSEGRACVVDGRAIEVALVEIDMDKVKVLVRHGSSVTHLRVEGRAPDAPPRLALAHLLVSGDLLLGVPVGLRLHPGSGLQSKARGHGLLAPGMLRAPRASPRGC